MNLQLDTKLHDPRLPTHANRVLDRKHLNNNIILLGGDEDLRRSDCGRKRVHADPVFVEKLLYLRNNGHSLLLITQDKAMTADVLEINNLRSRHSKAVVLVKKLTPDGFLADSQ